MLLGVLLTSCDKPESVENLVAKAKALHAAGNFPAAVVELKAALAQDPKSIAARLLSAQIYIDLGRGDAALGLLMSAQRDGARAREIAGPRAEAELVARRYEEVIKDTAAPPAGLPAAVRASLLAYRGAALAAQGREADGQAALKQGLALDPHSVDVRIASARIEIDRGDLDAARRELAAATRDAANDRRLEQLRGDTAYAAQDYPAAERIYREILDAEPWNDLARGDLAAVQVAETKLSEAIATLDKVLLNPDLADVPKPPNLSYVRAVAALRQKDYTAAQADSEDVIKQVSGFEPARLIAAASSYALHEYERANYYLGPYIALHPEDLGARKLLATIQLQLGRPGDAIKTLAPVRDKASADPELLTLLGTASARAGDVTTANRYMKLLLARQPDDGGLRTEVGVAEIAAGDPKAAVDNLEQVVKAHPDAAAPLFPLAVALMQAKQYDKALAIADQMIKSEPHSPTGELLAAAVYLAQGNRAADRAALLKARQIHPGDINADSNLAKLALAEGKADEARRYYQDILAVNRQSTQTYLALAALDAATGHPQAAETVLRNGVQANPTVPELNAALLRLQLARGETRQALTGAQQALKKFPQNPGLLDIVGHAELALGQPDAALSTFHDLLDIVPGAATAHAGLAEAYLAKYTPGHPQWPAVNEAIEAVKLDPHDTAAKLILARALIAHGRFLEASKVVAELKAASANSLEMIEVAGLLARGQGRLADAISSFARAVTLGNNELDRRRLADAEMQLGRPDDAATTLKTWLAAHPQDADARAMLADICVKAGRLAEAAGQYAELAKQRPKDPVAQNNLAWLLARLDHVDQALKHARAAVALAPGSIDDLDTLGTIQLRHGDVAGAVASLDQAWRADAKRPDVGFHLSQALAAAGNNSAALALLRRLLAGNEAFAERVQAENLLHQLGG